MVSLAFHLWLMKMYACIRSRIHLCRLFAAAKLGLHAYMIEVNSSSSCCRTGTSRSGRLGCCFCWWRGKTVQGSPPIGVATTAFLFLLWGQSMGLCSSTFLHFIEKTCRPNGRVLRGRFSLWLVGYTWGNQQVKWYEELAGLIERALN